MKDIIKQIFSIPSFIKALSKLNIGSIRNVNYPECKSGLQAWKDMARDGIVINGQNINISEEINASDQDVKTLQGYACRLTLSQILQSKFNEACDAIPSVVDVNHLLIDECITMLNQTSLHGAIFTTIMPHLIEDIKSKRKNIPLDIFPIIKHFDTAITILEGDKGNRLRIKYTEISDLATECKDSADGLMYCGHVIGTLSFDISVPLNKQNGKIYYSNVEASIGIPQQGIVGEIYNSKRKLISFNNFLIPLKNFLLKIISFITNKPFHKQSKCERRIGDDGVVLLRCKLPNYRCQAVVTSITEKELLETQIKILEHQLEHENKIAQQSHKKQQEQEQEQEQEQNTTRSQGIEVSDVSHVNNLAKNSDNQSIQESNTSRAL